MRFKFDMTRRPAFLALLVGAGMVYVAIKGFDVEPGEMLQVALFSLVLVLLIAIPAALVVVLWKAVQKWLEKDEGN